MTNLVQKGDLNSSHFTNNNSNNAGGIGVNTGAGSPVQTAINAAAGNVGNVSAGANVSLSGTGSAADPIVISANVESFETFTLTGTAVAVGALVSLRSDGAVELTDSSNVESWLGIAKTSADPIRVWLNGQTASGLTGLTTGTRYYVSDTGTLTSTTNSRPIGRALSATTLRIDYVGNEA